MNKIENINDSKLEKPSILYKNSFIEAMKEFLEEGPNPDIGEGGLKEEDIVNFQENFEEFLQKTENKEKGLNLKEGYVPDSTRWLIDKNDFIGRVSIRHKLTEELSQLGGHIGVAIRLSKRGMGYGSKILELGLLEAKKLGLEKVLLTCDDTNIGSWKMIEKNGGVLEDKIENIKDSNKITRRYWIDIK